MHINYISTKQLIGRILNGIGLESTNFVDSFPQWIEDAINIIGIPKYYIHKHYVININQHKGSLPCDIESIHSLWVDINLNSFSERNCLRHLTIRNNPLIGNEIKLPYHETAYGNINGRFLETSFYKGKVLIVYKGIPCDDEGYPLAPSNADFIQAFEYYVIMRLALIGYKHPILTYEQAYQLWEKHYPRAGNSINWMSLPEYQEFTEMWNNSILGDLQSLNYIH